MGFLDMVRRAADHLEEQRRLSVGALRREFELDDDALEDLVHELVEVQGLADRDGEILVAAPDQAPEQPGPVSLALGESEHRELTVLFCDVVGSTELSTRLDAEDFGDAIRVYHAAATEVLERFGGHVASLIGDGILALFGYPVAHDDSADQAVRAALATIEAVDQLDTGFDVRVGIHSGPCVVSNAGHAGGAGALALGETVNVAARVETSAEPGTVLISNATRRLVTGWFELVSVGDHSLKGLAHPVELHRVIRQTSARTRLEARSSHGLTTIVGRANERNQLAAAWERARDGDGQVVLISGEGGIGKSRLVRDLHQQLTDETPRWLEGACTPYTTNTALHPCVALIEDLLEFDQIPDPADRLRRVEEALGGAGAFDTEQVAVIASLLSLRDADSPPLNRLSPEARRERTLDGLADWVMALGTDEPLVLIVEDLHWCDPSTLELLGRLVGRVAASHLLIVATARPDFAPPWPADDLRVIPLERLSSGESAAIVNELAARLALQAHVHDSIIDRANGNPLFIEEITSMVGDVFAAGPIDQGVVLDVPPTLQSTLLARLDRLGPAKHAAQIAAVIGREFSERLLTLVVEQTGDLLRRQASADGLLDQLVKSGVLIQRPDQRYEFRHALIQDAANQSSTKKRRRELHAAVLDVLRAHFPDQLAADPETAARHAASAGRTAEAIDLYHAAADTAIARSAEEEAIEYLGRAIGLATSDLPADEAIRREIELQRALAVVLIVARGYTHAETAAAWERVRTLSVASNDLRGYGASLLGLAIVQYGVGAMDEATGLIEEVLDVAARSGATDQVLAAYGELTSVSYFRGDFRAALGHAENATALYDPEVHHRAMIALVGDDPGLTALCNSGWALLQLGYLDQALARTGSAIAVAESLGHPFSIAQTRVWRLAAQVELGHERLESDAGELLRYTQDQGFPVLEGTAMIMLGAARGDPALVLEGAGLAAESDLSPMTPAAMLFLGQAYAAHDAFDDALATVQAGIDVAQAIDSPFYNGNLYRLKAELILGRNPVPTAEDLAQSERLLRDAIDLARRQEAKLIELRAATSLGHRLQIDGRHLEAHELLAPLYRWFDEGLETRDVVAARDMLTQLES